MRGMERSARRAGGGQEEAMFTALIRTVILYILIIAGVRLMGKRQVGELEPSELVLSLLIADLASVPMQDLGIPLHAGVVPILALLSLTMILSVLTMKSIRFRTLMCGRPSIVVRDGKVDQGEMRRNRLTVDELLEELRGQGYTDLAGVKYGILETNGRLSVLPYAEQRPATARQLGLESRETGLPVVIISDGRILQDNLKRRGLDPVLAGQAAGGARVSRLPGRVPADSGRGRGRVFRPQGGKVGNGRDEAPLGGGGHPGRSAGRRPGYRLVGGRTDCRLCFPAGAGPGHE